MRKAAVLVCAVILVVSCSSVKNANVDYAHDFDFGSVKTFTYIDTPESNIGSHNERIETIFPPS